MQRHHILYQSAINTTSSEWFASFRIPTHLALFVPPYSRRKLLHGCDRYDVAVRAAVNKSKTLAGT